MSKLVNFRLRTCAVLPLAVSAAFTAGGVSDAPAKGASYKVIYVFSGTNGDEPFGGVIRDKSGDLFGTTELGGQNGVEGGTVFKLAPDGSETLLLNFDCKKLGCGPWSTLIEDSAGNLYGTTVSGGPKGPSGPGVVFRLAPDGKEKVLHSFTGGNDGGDPEYNLIADKEGNLYSTATRGGADGDGVVFKLAPGDKETVLYSFTGGNDGAWPSSGLLAIAGNLYGTAQYGGAGSCSGGEVQGCGTVYELVKGQNGAYTFKLLYAFTGEADGYYPLGNLIADSAGNLYGTAILGGGNDDGTVFKIAPDGTETTLYSFTGASGYLPTSGVIADKQGNLYGTTEEGGSDNDGVVFELAADGTQTVLHSFAGSPNDGAYPDRGALLPSGDYLYGATVSGGAGEDGTVFRIKK